MSLVNDMLRDLAGQQPGPNMPADEHKQWLADSNLARKPQRVWLPSLLVFVAVLILLVVLQHFFRVPNESANSQLPSEPQQSLIDVSMTESQLPLKADSDVKAAPNLEATAEEIQPAQIQQTLIVGKDRDRDTNGDSDEDNGAAQQVIDVWLALAKRALMQDRLTAPFEDSAYNYYRQVLAVVPQHSQALLGMENIVARYAELVHEALEQDEFMRAQTLLRRARLVIADHPALAALEAQLIQQQTQLAGRQTINAGDAIPVNQTQKLASAETQTESYSLPAQLPLSGSIQVTPNRAWQDQQAATQARELIQQGQLQAARLQLEVFLQQQGNASISSQLLCTLYLEQGDLLAAAKLLAGTQADNWPANDRLRLRAQLLMVQGETQEARALLEANLGSAEDDERYRALLASLYQADGSYHEAVASYRRLLGTFGEKSAYWLGLALALDALEQKASAVESYRHAQSFQNLQAEVNSYIEQRIMALSR